MMIALLIYEAGLGRETEYLLYKFLIVDNESRRLTYLR